MDTFIRGVREISRAAGVAAAFLIGLGVLVICDMVVERYIFGRTTIWQIDVVTYAIVGATFIGSAYVLMYRGHVNVDILPMWLRPRARFWLALFTTVVSMGFCVTLLIVTSRYWYEAYSQNWRSNTVWRARLWIPYLAMPAGVGLLVLQYVAEFLSLVTGREPPFGIVDRKKAA
ncbi:MAG TPA: TRAP transporter small permease [Usitatibacter sp.]|nr:TRAP transporter small permease [Usitatibacter sp.]